MRDFPNDLDDNDLDDIQDVPAVLEPPTHEPATTCVVGGLSDAEAALVTEHRRKVAARVSAEQRRSEQAGVVVRLFKGERWLPAGGRSVKVSEMTPRHAGNTYALLERRWPMHPWAHTFWRGSVPEAFRLADDYSAVPSTLIDTRLGRALLARSKERATWRERRADKRSRKEWEAKRAASIDSTDEAW